MLKVSQNYVVLNCDLFSAPHPLQLPQSRAVGAAEQRVSVQRVVALDALSSWRDGNINIHIKEQQQQQQQQGTSKKPQKKYNILRICLLFLERFYTWEKSSYPSTSV